MEHFAAQLKTHLHDKGFTTVEQIIIERTPDWAGEESIFAWLLLDDAVTATDLDWTHIRPLKEATQDEIRNHYPDMYPYVRVRRVAEWQEIVNA